MRNLPRCPSSSITYGEVTVAGATSSINGTEPRLLPALGRSDPAIRRDGLYSRRSARATGLTPCSRASSPAAIQSDSGIADRPVSFSAPALQSSVYHSHRQGELRCGFWPQSSSCPVGRWTDPTTCEKN
jgi:hypothetical protein